MVEADSRVLGFILLRPRGRRSQAGRQTALHLLTIDVAPEARRRGIGILMMQWALAAGARVSASVLELEVAVDNTAAQAFYARFGFRAIGTIPGYYPGGLDAIAMELILPN